MKKKRFTKGLSTSQQEKKQQPPDWDVEEAAYTEANYQFIQTEVSKKYNDDDRHKLMVNLFIWIGFLSVY